jgi:sterol desaturase/sphingolipid hydroxylase (fatty acid hydroxylase superfamily)
MLKHFLRFCSTLEVLHFPLIIWAFYVSKINYLPGYSEVGTLLGFFIYTILEVPTHRGMHENKWSPFYKPHHQHHNTPSPETGVPKWWMFVFYTVLTGTIQYFALPVISAIWISILLMVTFYEWIHFLCHCRYRPKTKWGWKVRINHLKHHKVDPYKYYEMLFPEKN